MAGKVFFGMFPRQSLQCSISVNIWGRLSRCSYSTAQRIEANTVKASLTESECEAHNRKIPTYKQIKSDPELQRKLAEMYKSQNNDPEFRRLIVESTKWGVRVMEKEED